MFRISAIKGWFRGALVAVALIGTGVLTLGATSGSAHAQYYHPYYGYPYYYNYPYYTGYSPYYGYPYGYGYGYPVGVRLGWGWGWHGGGWHGGGHWHR